MNHPSAGAFAKQKPAGGNPSPVRVGRACLSPSWGWQPCGGRRRDGLTLRGAKAQFEVGFFSLWLALGWSWSPAAPGALSFGGSHPHRGCQSAGKQGERVGRATAPRGASNSCKHLPAPGKACRLNSGKPDPATRGTPALGQSSLQAADPVFALLLELGILCGVWLFNINLP